MAKNFIREGDTIDITAAAAITAGDPIIVGNLIAVALVDWAIGGTGAAALEGVFELPKVAAAVIGQGETVVFKAAAAAFDDNLAALVGGDLSTGCIAHSAAINGATVVNVAINVGTNVVT